jgi:hypothetical protein
VQRCKQPVPTSVAGKDPPGAITAVGRGSQTKDEDRGLLSTKAGDRSAPVVLTRKRLPAVPSNLFSPGNQPWTGTAVADPTVKAREICCARGLSLDGRDIYGWPGSHLS